MAFKRKRSDSELFNQFTSPARSDSSVDSFDFPVSPSPSFPRAYVTPSHLPSRTMKRFRDNRPSADEIHQRTLNMLYSAQQQNQDLAHTNPHNSIPAPSPAPAASSSQKSLHSFWNIKSAAPATTMSTPSTTNQMALDPPSCEDCGAGLGSSGGAADGMDVDDGYDYGQAGHSCGACGKHVCSHCSITNLGEQRRCLQCAGRKPCGAAGGLGWTTSSLRIC
ncbi:hypothetical protein CCHL11_07876 [Colletotrichum chlorophyti]|uniref:Uncharacterized protein n=1 Tax=Colletotrichum chlorophyti TaxID=708187 RepID=A0A1Q8RR41_9PEZI|nr:hypothetical protein CCHL11_07876 [Colletotrichum chlorophyti]